MSLNFTLYYIIAFTALSGLGIVFLNAESILAFCFFVFVALIVKYDPLSSALEEQRRIIRSDLMNCMIDGEIKLVSSKKILCFKKAQLLASLEHMTSKVDNN
jgi:hypothetical protein